MIEKEKVWIWVDREEEEDPRGAGEGETNYNVLYRKKIYFQLKKLKRSILLYEMPTGSTLT